MRVAEAAWVAGVLDTCGRLTSRTLSSGTELVDVSVHSPNVPLLERLAELTGVRHVVISRRYPKAGCAQHCPERHVHVVSVSARWQVTGARATVLLFNALPYLRLHQEQATWLLGVGLRTRWTSAPVADMRRLGWRIPERLPPRLQVVGGDRDQPAEQQPDHQAGRGRHAN